MKEAPVPPALSGRPLDGAVRTLFSFSWNQAREAVRTGKIAVDGVVITDGLKFVRTGQTVRWDEAARRPRPETDLPKEAVAFVDNHVVVVEKPSGISTIPFDEKETGTLDARVRSWLAAHDRNLRGARGAPPTLGIVHRIDKETSGVMVAAKTDAAHQGLSALFSRHDIDRMYLALVRGAPQPAADTITTQLGRSPGDRKKMAVLKVGGREAITDYGVQKAYAVPARAGAAPLASRVACTLQTGRTHQIRVHMASKGSPILGDAVYGSGSPAIPVRAAIAEAGLTRQALHASVLGFVHPVTGEPLRFETDLPPDMQALETLLSAL